MKHKDECVCESCSKKSRWLFQIMSKNIEFQYRYSHATIQMRSQTRLYPNQQVLAVERWNAPPQFVPIQIMPTLFPPKNSAIFFLFNSFALSLAAFTLFIGYSSHTQEFNQIGNLCTTSIVLGDFPS